MSDEPTSGVEAVREAAQALIDAAKMRTVGFMVPMPAIARLSASLSATAAFPTKADLISAISLAENYLSEHIEKYHDYEDDTPERASLRGIAHHLAGSLIGDDGEFVGAPAASPATPPEGYHRLPDGQVCKCIKSWTHADGSRWCCLTPPASPSPAPAAVEAELRQALRNIAEGNLGDEPWQANYARIREVAVAALATPAASPDDKVAQAIEDMNYFTSQVASNGICYVPQSRIAKWCQCLSALAAKNSSPSHPMEEPVAGWRRLTALELDDAFDRVYVEVVAARRARKGQP